MGLVKAISVIAGADIDHAAEQISPLCYVRPNPALWNVLKPRLEASFRKAASDSRSTCAVGWGAARSGCYPTTTRRQQGTEPFLLKDPTRQQHLSELSSVYEGYGSPPHLMSERAGEQG
jgi:hypothetical protein